MPAKYPSLTEKILGEAGRSILQLRSQFKYKKNKERWIQAVLFGYLQARLGNMKIEYRVGNKFIDFRFSRPHPALLELVTIRKTKHPVEHLAYRNRSELRKLGTYPASRTQRILLILDLNYDNPLDEIDLYMQYQNEWAKIARRIRKRIIHGITILYMHPKLEKPERIVLRQVQT